jgi:hypothetical protein
LAGSRRQRCSGQMITSVLILILREIINVYLIWIDEGESEGETPGLILTALYPI